MATQETAIDSPRRSSRTVPLTAALAAFVLWLLDLAVTFAYNGFDTFVSLRLFAGLVVHGLPTIVVLAIAYSLAGNPLREDRYPRLVRWCLAGACISAVMNLALIAVYTQPRPEANVGWALFSATMGLSAGFLVGWREGVAIDRAVEAERDAVEREVLADERDLLEYVNSLVRHEVLNNAQVIQGQSELLLADVEDSSVCDRLETIRIRSTDMVDVVRDVRVLIETRHGDLSMDRRDVADLVRERLAELEVTYPSVETDLTVDDTDEVMADDLLGRVFDNILTNAVEHTDGSETRVDVTVETTPDRVRVSITDDGQGIDEDDVEGLFEYTSASQGAGLYLVRVLASRYDATVELTDTGPDGTTFTVETPRADAPDGEIAGTTGGPLSLGSE